MEVGDVLEVEGRVEVELQLCGGGGGLRACEPHEPVGYSSNQVLAPHPAHDVASLPSNLTFAFTLLLASFTSPPSRLEYSIVSFRCTPVVRRYG